jgi:hypothetical protein
LVSTSNTITLLWCKQSKERGEVKVYIPSLEQRGRRDTLLLLRLLPQLYNSVKVLACSIIPLHGGEEIQLY